MKPFVVLLQQGVVDSRTVVEAVDVGFRDKPHKVVVACEVLCVKAKMVTRFTLVAIFVVAVRYVHLTAENRLDLR